MSLEQPTAPLDDATLIKLAEEPVACPDTDAITFLGLQGWRPGRTKGPRVASLFYYYREHGGTDSGWNFKRSLTILGFRRQSHRILLHSDDAEVLNTWSKRNPTPDRFRKAVNTAARPSQRLLPAPPAPPVGSPSCPTP